MARFGRNLRIALAGAGLVLAGACAGLAAPALAGDGAGPVSRAPSGARAPVGGQAYVGPVHVESTFAYLDGTTRAFATDLGVVASVEGGAIVLERPDGRTVSVPTDAETCVVVDGAPSALEEVEPGMRAVVHAEGGTAEVVRAGLVRPREPVCREPEGALHSDLMVTFVDGRTAEGAWDRGMITAIDPGVRTISVIRRDATTVTLSYDDRTRVFDERIGSVGELEVGDAAVFLSQELPGGSLVARAIRCVMPGIPAGRSA